MALKLSEKHYNEAIENVVNKYPEQIKESHYKDFIWNLAIVGPENSIYKGGVFDIEIELPIGYFGRPLVYFNTSIYHPNIGYFYDENGKYPRPQADRLSLCYSHCLKFIEGDDIIMSTLGRVFSVLEHPDTICEHNGEVTELLKYDKKQFYNTAKEWTHSFANRLKK